MCLSSNKRSKIVDRGAISINLTRLPRGLKSTHAWSTFPRGNFGVARKSKGFFPPKASWLREYPESRISRNALTSTIDRRCSRNASTAPRRTRRGKDETSRAFGRWPDSPQPLMFIVILAFSRWVLIFFPTSAHGTGRTIAGSSGRYDTPSGKYELLNLDKGSRVRDDTYARTYVCMYRQREAACNKTARTQPEYSL